MEKPKLPRRIYTLGEEPPAVHSISYHTCWTLHVALKKAFHDDEYEELKESKLGVFIKFQELGFDWASRLVHYMLGFQLDIKKNYELWSLVGPQPVRFSLLEFENLTGLNCEYIEDLKRPHCIVTKELTSFWEMLGVHVEARSSTQEIIAAFERCEWWSRDDRKRLALSKIRSRFCQRRFRWRFPSILSNPSFSSFSLFSPPVISPPFTPSFSPPFSQPLPLFKIREETLARILSEASRKKMEMPELPRRIYTLGEVPPAVHSISYHTCWTLHAALKKALHDDEYEELKESKLGVFIKFQELGFDWASRVVHYMLGFQLDIKKKYELWSLVGPEPMRFSLLEFEHLTGLNCEYIEDLERPHSVITK
ncbi:hypothetical protein F2Q69_00060336 [Brassica cretica]|uniref:DUF1985 domain-containing protein n=1 Tax=Brassica cretica TaxID=69181 RepID=A0A8S9RPM3_BRACR|nr:hypothetical protein F2Q69_00060336 [Brassica cretica]